MIVRGKKLICDLKTDMMEDELALLTLAFNPLLHNNALDTFEISCI